MFLDGFAWCAVLDASSSVVAEVEISGLWMSQGRMSPEHLNGSQQGPARTDLPVLCVPIPEALCPCAHLNPGTVKCPYCTRWWGRYKRDMGYSETVLSEVMQMPKI